MPKESIFDHFKNYSDNLCFHGVQYAQPVEYWIVIDDYTSRKFGSVIKNPGDSDEDMESKIIKEVQTIVGDQTDFWVYLF